MTGKTPRQWLAEEPYTLALSAGYFGFFSHAGVLKALLEEGVAPRRVIGVSAGALTGGLWAGGVAIDTIVEMLLSIRKDDFWDPGLPVGGLLRGQKFQRILENVLDGTGVSDIEHMPVPFAAVAFDIAALKPTSLERGSLPLAIRASCAVPLMFRPVVRGGRLLVDGGVTDRSGISAMGEDERVFCHFLPSNHGWGPLYNWQQRRQGTPSNRLRFTQKGLPPVSPDQLDNGARAYRQSYETTLRWLDSVVF